METDHLESLLKAKIRIMSGGPNLFFIGPVLANLKFIERNELPTFSTDGKNIYYNREFLLSIVNDPNGKGIDKLIFIIVHEIFHVILDHLGRRGDRDPLIWNLAIDYITNYILVDNNIGVMPPDVLYDKKYHSGLSSEEVYDMLLQDPLMNARAKNYKGFDIHIEIDELGDPAGANSDSQNPGGAKIQVDGDKIKIRVSRSDYEKMRQEMKEIVAGMQAGNMPEGIRRMFEKMIAPPQINWKEKLARFLEDSYRIDYHYKKLHHYSHYSLINHALPVLLPGIIHENRVSVHVYVDASGSISEKMLKEFISEVCGLVQNNPARDCSINISSFDTEIYGTQSYDTAITNPETIVRDLMAYEIKGGGGTSIERVWSHLNSVKNKSNGTNLVIIFTDGEIWNYGNPEEVDVPVKIMMVINNKYSRLESLIQKIPFGNDIDVAEMASDNSDK